MVESEQIKSSYYLGYRFLFMFSSLVEFFNYMYLPLLILGVYYSKIKYMFNGFAFC